MQVRPLTAWLIPMLVVGGGVGAAGREVGLSDAVKAGEWGVVSALLRGGADPNAASADGTSALQWAVHADDLDTARLLVEAGAGVNVTNRNGARPLSLACVNANPEMVSLLLAAGADPSLPSSGEPPLLTCARSGRLEAAEHLLGHGADVNASDNWKGQTALMWAAAENHSAMVELLLERGGDVQASSTDGGFTALMFAARQGALSSTRILLEAGADARAAARSGATLLHIAVSNRQYTIGTLLLDHGADPNATDKQGQTALHALVQARAPVRRQRNPELRDWQDSLDFMRILLARGADPNLRTKTAPRLTDEGTSSAIQPVIDNRTNLGQATPLLLAARASDVEAMRLLVEYEADPQLATSGNNTALMLAAGVVFVEGSAPFRTEAEALEAVRLALALGIDVNAVNDHGQTALHGAVYRAANTIIEELVAAGANVDLEDERGRTPLRLAEEGFNQVASLIRRDRAVELLRRLASGGSS